MPRELLILGCGFTGTEVARRASAAGWRVVATTRQAPQNDALPRLGVDLRVEPQLTLNCVRNLVFPGASVLVAFPPDGRTDPIIAAALAPAARVVYVSTTGVYGAHRGHVDEATPVDPAEPRASERLAAERIYRDVGAIALRAAGIYGPGRGLHRRLASGTFRVPGDGSHVVSRIHVADLARWVLGLCSREHDEARGEIFVAADDTPVPQIEVVAWLCRRLELAMPPHVPIGEAPATLRHDRAVDNRRIKARLGPSLLFPGYKEGFEACFAAEAASPPGFAGPRAETPPGSRRPSR
jgi:nucleoside-diphosphate-sugar epimerase